MTAVNAGNSIFFEGDPSEYFFQIEDGFVRAEQIFEDGSRQIIGLFWTGAYFGLANTGIYQFSTDAASDCRLRRLRRADLNRWLADNPNSTNWLLSAVNDEVCAIGIRALMIGCRTPMERFTTFLLHLARHQREGSGTGIHLPLTRSEIGDYLGLCMETVSRCVSRLRTEGIINAPTPHRLIIIDSEKMSGLANEELLERL